MEILLNRWRGTGDMFYISKFAITGTMIYSFYMFILVSILSNPIYGFIATVLFLAGESLAFGKWVGYLTYPENYDKEQFEANKKGSNFPFIHQTANYFINQSNPYNYSILALSIRGLYWWTPILTLLYCIDLISWYMLIINSIVLSFGFPFSCELSKYWKFEYKSKFISIVGNWEKQEVIYGFIQFICIAFSIFLFAIIK